MVAHSHRLLEMMPTLENSVTPENGARKWRKVRRLCNQKSFNNLLNNLKKLFKHPVVLRNTKTCLL